MCILIYTYIFIYIYIYIYIYESLLAHINYMRGWTKEILCQFVKRVKKNKRFLLVAFM